MRKKIIAGNWKMNNNLTKSLEVVAMLKDKVNTTESDVVFCVPFVNIIPVVEALELMKEKLEK